MSLTNWEVHLTRRPVGAPVVDDFRLVEAEVPEIADGQVLIRQLYMSVDPAMRPKLSDDYRVGEVMYGGAIGRILQSRHPGFAEGELVRNLLGFREYAASNGDGLQPLTPEPDIPVSAYLSVLGITGFTAYTGLIEVGHVKAGEQVFVSAAAGSVGSIAAQIAKLKGCYVVGSTGSDEKAAWLRELGLDAVINYRGAPIGEALRSAAVRGIDVYLDNVGGNHLDAALACMNAQGRVAVSGMIAAYNNSNVQLPVNNLWRIIYNRITIRGYVGSDYKHLRPRYEAEMVEWLRTGKIKWRETVLDGIGSVPRALVGLMRGENTGKMLVRLASMVPLHPDKPIL